MTASAGEVRVRVETPSDHAAIREVNDLAFGQPGEGRLVDRLRLEAETFVSLVAEEGGRVVGHICFTPVRLTGPAGGRTGMGLAPMAVLPEHQRRGIGGALVTAGLSACRSLSVPFVVVLGHPAYYPRFGFVPASRFGVTSAYEAPDEAFMALELSVGALFGGGKVAFHPAFGEVGG